ncbi:hypothetical protein [Halalkalibacterium ligniniphilum]|uniref:hypothetical protein n=1 Tax=Halalkalibacterium ligniniphilum TaxID=1134413 RepID=UPI00034958E0|nr:hypothetical protein [Halalkalibacterium ligniniphilum]
MNEKIEIDTSEYEILKRHSRLYSELKRTMQEFIGYEDDYLTTHKTMKKFTKKEMVELLMIKRQMIRKIFDQLPSDIQKENKDHIEELLKTK